MLRTENGPEAGLFSALRRHKVPMSRDIGRSISLGPPGKGREVASLLFQRLKRSKFILGTRLT